MLRNGKSSDQQLEALYAQSAKSKKKRKKRRGFVKEKSIWPASRPSVRKRKRPA